MENIYSMDWTYNIILNNVVRSENHVLDDDTEYDPDYYETLEKRERLFEKCGE